LLLLIFHSDFHVNKMRDILINICFAHHFFNTYLPLLTFLFFSYYSRFLSLQKFSFKLISLRFSLPHSANDFFFIVILQISCGICSPKRYGSICEACPLWLFLRWAFRFNRILSVSIWEIIQRAFLSFSLLSKSTAASAKRAIRFVTLSVLLDASSFAIWKELISGMHKPLVVSKILLSY